VPSTTLPSSHADLLDRSLFAHLATVRPGGEPQSSVMWFAWDGTHLRFTHTRGRQKFRNLAHEPRVAVSVHDPDDPYRHLEVRGEVVSIDADADAEFYLGLQRRYGMSYPATDAPERVVVTVRPTAFVAVTGGLVDAPSS
jgi:PPOX class probable F420-dependent enzyme